jgi:hypothetical protein
MRANGTKMWDFVWEKFATKKNIIRIHVKMDKNTLFRYIHVIFKQQYS